MATNKIAKISPKLLHIFFGEVIVTSVTIIVTLAFIGSEPLAILRNVIVLDFVFLAIYVLWLKLFGNYEKIYKAGLKED